EHRYPALPWSHAFDVKTMMKYLPDTTAVWEYFTGPGKWFAFALNHKGLQGFTLLGKADHLKSDITAFVSHWFDHGPEAMINAPEKFKKQSFEIYKQIGLKLPEEDTHLLFIPDGKLGKLPFDALITDTKDRLNPGHWSYLLWKAMTSQSY